METMRDLFEAIETRGGAWGEMVFMGDGARLTISKIGGNYKLEELPVKGKRQVRVADLSSGFMSGQMNPAWDSLLVENVLQDAKLDDGDNYEAIKRKILAAVEAARKDVLKRWKGENRPDWLGDRGGWNEKTVPAGRVAPAAADVEILAQGKDFTLKSTWKHFEAYSPQSDFQQADPFYMGVREKGPAAAAKLYKILQVNANVLKDVSYYGLQPWLDKQRVAWESAHSSW